MFCSVPLFEVDCQALPSSHLLAGCEHFYLQTAVWQSLLVIIKRSVRGGLGGSSRHLLAESGFEGPSFNWHSPPQTQAGLLGMSAGQPVGCGTFPNHQQPCFSLSSSSSLHSACLTTHGSNEGVMGKRRGFTATENPKGQTCGVFCVEMHGSTVMSLLQPLP